VTGRCLPWRDCVLAEAVEGCGSLSKWRGVKHVEHPSVQVLYSVQGTMFGRWGSTFERKADAPSSGYSKETLKGIIEVLHCFAYFNL
jgi:hypothetical protein